MKLHHYICALEHHFVHTGLFYAPEGTSGGKLKSNRLSVRLLQIVSQRYLINY